MTEKTNVGAIALTRALRARGARVALAKKLAVGPDLVSRWVAGQRTPDTKHRAFLEDELHISWRLWDQEVEQEQVAQIEADLAAQEAAAPVRAPTFLDSLASTGTDGVG